MFGVRLWGDGRRPELDEKHEVIRAAASNPASSLMLPLSTPEEMSTRLYRPVCHDRPPIANP